jgi:hydrogenase maturation protease
MARPDGQSPRPTAKGAPVVFVGGVGQLYQGDLDLGRIVVERLQREGLGPGVLAEDLYYGAIAVCQRLQELHPDAVVLVGAATRGRQPGSVTRLEIAPLAGSPENLQRAVAEAATGYVSIDLILEVATALDALPEQTVIIEVEPETVVPSPSLSETAQRAADEALELVRREVEQLPARIG